jgi:hypothetical protein
LNVLVEARAGDLVRRKPCLQGSLRVQWLQNFGQLAVTQSSTGKPLSKVYVKVYAKQSDGGVRFHKDGYTDLRGRFDYASLSGSGLAGATRSRSLSKKPTAPHRRSRPARAVSFEFSGAAANVQRRTNARPPQLLDQGIQHVRSPP